jgi:hypothetical protein
VVQHSHPATQSHAHVSHFPHALSLQQPDVFAVAAPANDTFDAASNAASAVAPLAVLPAQQAGLVVVTAAVLACAAQHWHAQPSPHVQTPVSQHWQPATQSQSQFVQSWHDPPEQHPPADLAVAAAPPDITNPSADTPVSARNVNNLPMRNPFADDESHASRGATSTTFTTPTTRIENRAANSGRDSLRTDQFCHVQYRICSGGSEIRPGECSHRAVGDGRLTTVGRADQTTSANSNVGVHGSTGDTGVAGLGRDDSHFGHP